MEGGVAAHRQAADVRPLEPERVEEPPDVLDGLILGVGAPVRRDVGRRVAAGVVSDRAEATGEEADLGDQLCPSPANSWTKTRGAP